MNPPASFELGAPAPASPWPPPPPGWCEALRGRSAALMREAALVLASTGVPHALESDGRGSRLLVPLEFEASAGRQLEAYRTENADWPPALAEPIRRSDGVVGAAWYVATLVLAFALSKMDSLGLGWWEAGRLDARLVREGELERTLTALTLHVDFLHLVSNLVFGVAFGVLASFALGGGLTWAFALLSGAAGNLVNAWIQSAEHRSVGASTAVFGLLGVLVAYEVTRRHVAREARFRRIAPAMAGAVLLGWLGVGDGDGVGRVDVMAHVTGMSAGCACGALAGIASLPLRIGRRGQAWLGAIAGLALGAAWWIALG